MKIDLRKQGRQFRLGYADIIVTGAVMPEQFFEQVHSTPEKGLMLAILEDAIECFHKGLILVESKSLQRQRLRRGKEAEEWLFSDDCQWPFSFINICGMLGLEADYLRRGLQKWKKGEMPATQMYLRGLTGKNMTRIAA